MWVYILMLAGCRMLLTGNKQVLRLVRAFFVAGCDLSSQYGLEVVHNAVQLSGMLPATLAPGKELNLAFVLQRARPSSRTFQQQYGDAAARDACLLDLQYQLLPGTQQPAPVKAVYPPCASTSNFARSTWEEIAFPQPPDMPLAGPAGAAAAAHQLSPASSAGLPSTAAAAAGGRAKLDSAGSHGGMDERFGGGGLGAGCAKTADDKGASLSTSTSQSGPPSVFPFSFYLELPELASQGENMVVIKTLGPFNGRAGQRMCITWQLMRTAAPLPPRDVPAPDDELLHYEVADSNGQGEWSSADRSRGCVRLGCCAGSTATVEAVVTPMATGQVAAPELKVRGLHSGMQAEQSYVNVRPMA